MGANVSFSPFQTSNAAGSFQIESGGFVQGVALPAPNARYSLAGGILAATETLPMWGGLAISESILPAAYTNKSVGENIARATAVANITGFSVFDQATAWITSPQSECPSAAAGMTVPFYRLGSGARIPLAIDPSMVSLSGGLTTQQVSWDFNNGRLQPYDAAAATQAVTSLTPTYANGVYTVAVVLPAASSIGAVGDAVNISGSTGTGANLVNGNQIVTAWTDSQHFSYQVVAANGAIGTQAGTPLLNFGTGALPIRIIRLSLNNSKIVQYDAANNLVHWVNNGSTAIALI